MSLDRHSSVWRLTLLLFWITGALLGFGQLWSYEATPGETGRVPVLFPAAAGSLRRASQKSTLLVFLHPRCPCSRATLDTLEAVLSRLADRAECTTIFYCPAGQNAPWCHGELWDRATRLGPVVVDPQGQLAQRFGALTSGEALLYSAQGKLLFAGGLTAGRGHAGDSGGGAALAAVLTGHSVGLRYAPTFGCEMCGQCRVRSSDGTH